MIAKSNPQRGRVSDLKYRSEKDSQALSSIVRRGAFWSIASTVLLRLAGVFATAVIAHILDRQDFGVFAIALAAYTIVTAVGELGLASCLIRADLDIDSLAPTMVTVSLTTNAIQAGAMVAFAKPIATALGSAAAAGPIRVLALVMFIVGAFAVPNCQLIRDFKQNKLFLAQVIGFVPATLLLILLAKSGGGAMAFAWSMLVGQVFSGCVVVASVPKIYLPGISRSALSILWKSGLPLGAANIINFILVNVDYALIGHLIGAVALGTYVLAFNIASWPASLLGNMVNHVSMPAFSRVKHDADLLGNTVASALRALSLVVMPISALSIALARPLILTMYGAKWIASAEVLSVLALYGAISIICVLFANVLAGLGLSKFLFVVQIIWLGALVPAMVLGVHGDDLVGAAFAHIAVLAPIVLPTYLLVLKRKTGVRLAGLAKAILPGLLAAVAAALAARGLASHFTNSLVQLTIGLATGGLIYAVAVAPQAIEMLNRGRPGNLYAKRVLYLYSAATRLIGLRVRTPPKHSGKGGGQRGRQRPLLAGEPRQATPCPAPVLTPPSVDVAESTAAALALLISLGRLEPAVLPVSTRARIGPTGRLTHTRLHDESLPELRPHGPGGVGAAGSDGAIAAERSG